MKLMEPTQNPIQDSIQSPSEFIGPQAKPKWSIVVFSILGIIFLTSTIFLFFQNQQLKKQAVSVQVVPTAQVLLPTLQSVSPTPKTFSSISIPPDETASWKEYISSKFGFTFRHPNFDDKCCGLAGAVSDSPELVVTLANKSIVIPNTDAPFDGIAIYIVPNENDSSLDQYIEKEKKALYDQFKIMADANQVHKGQILKTSIAGQPAITLINYSWDGITRTYLKHKNTKTIIEISKKEKSLNHFNDYDQILSTFKFIH